MMAPRSKLLLWFGLTALPLSLIPALKPEATAVATLGIGVLLLLLLLDALRAYGSLDHLHVELPPVLRLSKDREGTLELRVHNQTRQARTLRVGLPFPREITSPLEDQSIQLAADAEWSTAHWPCTAVRRGNYALNTVYVEGVSPFGFWSVRNAQPVATQIRVYPNLKQDRKSLAALFLNRGAFGVHAHRQVGKGRDFEKLREYVPGDSYDDIHWKATARRARPITKVFQIEKTQEVYVVIDASRLSARSGRGTMAPAPEVGTSVEATIQEETLLERFVTSALVLGMAAEHHGDLFGLLTFSDRVEAFVRAKNGKAHYQTCRDALYTLHPREVTPDFDDVATFLRHTLRRRALLIFLTSLDDPVAAENFVRHAELLCRQHVVLVNMPKPADAAPMFSNPEAPDVDALYRRLGGHLQWHNLRELQKVLERRGVKFSLVDNDRLSVELVAQYLSVKQRQLI
ncbi:MAG: DUF58 domain-containing protein [Verrucomicrobiota bacterium]